MYAQFAARCSPLAAGHSPLAPRPGDLTPPDNSQRARPLSAQITNTFRPPCSRDETVAALFLSSWSRSQRSILSEEPVFPVACRGSIEKRSY